jgi:hypothetical protein
MNEKTPNVHCAYFDISYVFLCEMLGLPEGTKIVRVFTPDDGTFHQLEKFRVVVTHSDLPEAREGQQMQEIAPTFQAQYAGYKFMDWGIV